MIRRGFPWVWRHVLPSTKALPRAQHAALFFSSSKTNIIFSANKHLQNHARTRPSRRPKGRLGAARCFTTTHGDEQRAGGRKGGWGLDFLRPKRRCGRLLLLLAIGAGARHAVLHEGAVPALQRETGLLRLFGARRESAAARLAAVACTMRDSVRLPPLFKSHATFALRLARYE